MESEEGGKLRVPTWVSQIDYFFQFVKNAGPEVDFTQGQVDCFLMKKKFNVIENLQSQIVVADLCMSESTC